MQQNQSELYYDHVQLNPITALTLNNAGGQNDPLVRRSPAISHRIMLWYQKSRNVGTSCIALNILYLKKVHPILQATLFDYY